MSNPNCPVCEVPTLAKERKEKVKYKSVKMAININTFVCPECDEVFVSEEEQSNYDARLSNFNAKMDIEDKKVNTH